MIYINRIESIIQFLNLCIRHFGLLYLLILQSKNNAATILDLGTYRSIAIRSWCRLSLIRVLQAFLVLGTSIIWSLLLELLILFLRYVSFKFCRSFQILFHLLGVVVVHLGPSDGQIMEFLPDDSTLIGSQFITGSIYHALDCRKLINYYQISVVSVVIDSVEVLLELEVIKVGVTSVVRQL